MQNRLYVGNRCISFALPVSVEKRVHYVGHSRRVQLLAQESVNPFGLRHWLREEIIVANMENIDVALVAEPIVQLFQVHRKVSPHVIITAGLPV